MPSGDSGEAARFIDLMVSSQTGSGKTAAFLLPVLHTLLSQQAQAEADERAEFRACRGRSRRQGRARPQAPQAQGPHQQRNFKAAARRPDRVPHA
jgi:superfamily II DNA/RNA helicase